MIDLKDYRGLPRAPKLDHLSEAERLERIRALWVEFAPVECIPGCTDCCDGGPPEAARLEWEAIPDDLQTVHHSVKVEQIGPATLKIAECPQRLTGQGCRIHAHRPLICRAFAAIQAKALRCPHGRRAAKLVSWGRWLSILSQYYALTAGEGLTPPPLDIEIAPGVSKKAEPRPAPPWRRK